MKSKVNNLLIVEIKAESSPAHELYSSAVITSFSYLISVVLQHSVAELVLCPRPVLESISSQRHWIHTLQHRYTDDGYCTLRYCRYMY